MRSSSGERKIYGILKEYEFNFKEEFTFKDLFVGINKTRLRFDFAVFDEFGDIDFLIEFQGRQHYNPSSKFGGINALRRQVYNDKRKVDYCIINNIPLVVIPYTEEKLINLDYILDKYDYALIKNKKEKERYHANYKRRP